MFAKFSIFIFSVFFAATNYGNLIPDSNSGFENKDSISNVTFMWKPANKELSEVCGITEDESYRGTSSLKVSTNLPASYGIFIKASKEDFNAGETYTVSAYIKAPENTGINIYLVTYDKLWDSPKGSKYEHYTIGTDWQQCKVTYKLPKDAKILGIIIRTSDSGQKTFYIDEAKIEEGTHSTPSEPGRIISKKENQAANIVPFSMNGKPDKEAWKNALSINRFFVTDGSGKEAPQKTEIRMMHDNKNIYLRFECEEDNILGMKSSSTPEKTDWNDDRIEFFINTCGVNGEQQLFYLSSNSKGVFATNWDVTPQIETFKNKKSWNVEMTLPIESFGKKNIAGQTWLISVGRFHRTSFNGASCLAPVKGHFRNIPQAYKPFVFSSEKRDGGKVICTQLGDTSVYANGTGRNLITFDILDKNLLEKDFSLKVLSTVGDKKVSEKAFTSKAPHNDGMLNFYYTTAGQEGEVLDFTLSADGKTYFQSTNQLDILRPMSRLAKITDPLYEPLLKKQTPPERFHISWTQPVRSDNYNIALKYAKAYSTDQLKKESKDAKIHFVSKDASDIYRKLKYVAKGNFYMSSESPDLKELAAGALAGKSLPPIVHGYYNLPGVSATGINGITEKPNGCFGWLPDPVNQQAYKESAEAILTRYGDNVKAYFVGDEQYMQNYSRGLKMFLEKQNMDNPSNFMTIADKEVKEKYGFGKFGIPWNINSKAPEYPYCRRAYISWLHDKILSVNKEIRDIVKSKYPDMPVISDDAHGIPSEHGVQYWYQYADIGSFQLGEGGGEIGRYVESYTMRSKMVKELSGVKKLLVIPHECDSGYPSGAASPEEMRELYSQVFRGGADGFHFWPASWGGSQPPDIDAASVATGYPTAWKYLLKVCETVNKMPDLNFPEKADTAIFVSDESLKCDPRKFNRFDGAFTLLGPSARSWFKFISDTMLEQNRASLEDYKIIYLPYMQFTKEETVKKLLDYVQKGGVLICGDPLAFENDISSAPLIRYRELLFGVKTISEGIENVKACEIGGKTVSVEGERLRIESVSSSAKVIGKYSDGSPAVVENKFGKGKTVYFAVSPFSEYSFKNDTWKTFMKELHTGYGGKIGYSIWRFKLPQLSIEEDASPSGKCLTGNYAYWNRFKFIDGMIYNLQTGGSYEIIQGENSQAFDFSKGRLTDRRTIFSRIEEYKKLEWKNWVDVFEKDGPVSIIVDLKNNYSLDNLKLFYSGNLPEIKISSSINKQNWLDAGVINSKTTATDEVAEVSYKFNKNAEHRYVRLNFSMEPSEKLILAEMEIWSKN